MSYPRRKITIECSDYACKELLPLLNTLKKMGNWGCSRQIKIEDFADNFYFDGDGSSKIYSISDESMDTK